jgi:DNA-directed RNA polymerase specialized sigma24 family protein
MRNDEAPALREFFSRFRALMKREARKLSIQHALRDEVVEDCLADVAMYLINSESEAPASLPAYLLGALHNRTLNIRRTTQRSEKRDSAALEDAHGMGEHAVLAVCSRATVDASAGPDAEVASLAPGLERLADALDGALKEDERQLLVWLGDWVPQTTIAKWMGMSFGATRVRIHRLRERLRAVALEHASTVGADERREIDRFLERSSARSPPNRAKTGA